MKRRHVKALAMSMAMALTLTAGMAGAPSITAKACAECGVAGCRPGGSGFEGGSVSVGDSGSSDSGSSSSSGSSSGGGSSYSGGGSSSGGSSSSSGSHSGGGDSYDGGEYVAYDGGSDNGGSYTPAPTGLAAKGQTTAVAGCETYREITEPGAGKYTIYHCGVKQCTAQVLDKDGNAAAYETAALAQIGDKWYVNFTTSADATGWTVANTQNDAAYPAKLGIAGFAVNGVAVTE